MPSENKPPKLQSSIVIALLVVLVILGHFKNTEHHPLGSVAVDKHDEIQENKQVLQNERQLSSTKNLGSHANLSELNAQLMRQGMWKDPKTGLIWDRCSIGQKWIDETCKGRTQSLEWSTARQKVAKHRLGGYADWQLPTVAQLRTLLRCDSGFQPSAEQTIPATPFAGEFTVATECQNVSHRSISMDLAIFPNMPNPSYWYGSNMTVFDVRRSVWSVSFRTGNAGQVSDDSDLYYRAVRTSESLGREAYAAIFSQEINDMNFLQEEVQNALIDSFKLESDRQLAKEGQWRDPNTGLIWMRCLLDQTWDGLFCRGKSAYIRGEDALEYVKKFNEDGYAGYSNWRIPRIEELASIRYCGDKDGWKLEEATAKSFLRGHREVAYQTLPNGQKVPERCAKTPDFRSALRLEIFPTYSSGIYENTWPISNWAVANHRDMWEVNFYYGYLQDQTDSTHSEMHLRLVRDAD